MASKNYATMPIKQLLNSTWNHISFTSISSNKSAANTSSDAALLRIQSMPLLSEDYFKQRQASVKNLLANETPTQSSKLSHYENTTRRMRSVSEPNHSEPVSLPFDAFSKSTGQIDGRYLPENATRLMQSLSEPNHSEPVSQPIDAFSKCTGQIDGRYLPENSKNYSNPNLISYLESDDECRKYGLSEANFVANSQPRPNFENQNNDQELGQIEKDNQEIAGPVYTLLRNVNTENHRVQEYVRKFEKTARRMRSVSESDHCKPISLPIVAFTKSTGQIDGRYSPEDSKNYSNPNLSSSLESDNECRKYGFTETDLVANIQPRPNSQKQNNGQDVIQIEKDNQQKAGPVYTPLIMNDDEKIDEYDQGPLLTPPETPSESIGQENESSGCCSGCMSVCCALVQREHLFDRFSVLNLLLTLVSMGLFVFDAYSDLKLAATYYTKIEYNEIYRVYFGLTLGFVIMPSLITQIYSYFVQVKHDFSNSKLLMYFFIHFFQLGVIFSYIRVIYYGLKLRYYECVKMEEDRSKLEGKYEIEVVFATINSLLESFMESAPQLVLQIYIMLMTKTVPLITVISCAGSLLSLSTTTVSTQRFYRVLNDKMQLSIPASIVILFWRACTILSRVVVFGLFMTVQPIVFFVCIILHWLVATVLIGKDLHEVWITYAYGMLLNGIYGFIYIFCFIDLHDVGNRTNIRIRSRMFIFYAVVVIENVVISCWWYLTQLRSPFGNLSSTSSNETSTSFPFGNLSSTSSNETSTSLPFGNLSSTSSNETIVENELFPTESAGIFPRQQAFIILVAVHGFFLLGMFFMQVYYQALHPKHSDSDLNSDLHSNSDSHSKSDLDSAF